MKRPRIVAAALLAVFIGVLVLIPTVTHLWHEVLPVYLILAVVLASVPLAAWFFAR